MGQTREALRIGVEQQHGKCDGRKPEGKAIQLRGGQNKDGAGDDDEGANERGREISSGNSAGTGTRIGGIDGSVGEPVESHGRGAGGKHRDDDPYKLMRTREARSGEHGSAESERESEDGVLPLDHFEDDAEVVEDGHGSRVSVLGSGVRGQWPGVSSHSVVGRLLGLSEMQKTAQRELSILVADSGLSTVTSAIWPSGAGWDGLY